MKNFKENTLLVLPVITILCMYFGYLIVALTEDVYLINFYPFYVAIFIAGCGIIKYMHRDLMFARAKDLRLDIIVKSWLLVFVTGLALVQTFFTQIHYTIQLIFYLLIPLFLIDIFTRHKVYKLCLEREQHGNRGTHLRP